MIFIKEDGQYIIVQCEKCGTDHRKHKTTFKQYGDEYHFNPPIKCDCGNVDNIAHKESNYRCIDYTNTPSDLTCPHCGSTQVQAFKKGFGLGKAVTGGVLLGGVGLLGGFVGSNKIMVTCLKCGKQWQAGK